MHKSTCFHAMYVFAVSGVWYICIHITIVLTTADTCNIMELRNYFVLLPDVMLYNVSCFCLIILDKWNQTRTVYEAPLFLLILCGPNDVLVETNALLFCTIYSLIPPSHTRIFLTSLYGSQKFTDLYYLATFTTDLRVVTSYYELFTVYYGLLRCIYGKIIQFVTSCHK